MKFDIITKFDADNQHRIIDLKAVIKKLLRDDIYFCKGYRILSFKASLKRKMPLVRIIGASALTYMSNLTTGNFSVRDVTNGLLGLNSKILKIINFKSLKKIKIHQIKAVVIYNDEISSLNTLKSVIPFFIYHIQNFLKKTSY